MIEIDREMIEMDREIKRLRDRSRDRQMYSIDPNKQTTVLSEFK